MYKRERELPGEGLLMGANPDSVNDHSATIVSFASGKGGCGKTTLAVNFANIVARTGCGVLLVDLDMSNRGSTGVFSQQIADCIDDERRPLTLRQILSVARRPAAEPRSPSRPKPIRLKKGLHFLPASVRGDAPWSREATTITERMELATRTVVHVARAALDEGIALPDVVEKLREGVQRLSDAVGSADPEGESLLSLVTEVGDSVRGIAEALSHLSRQDDGLRLPIEDLRQDILRFVRVLPLGLGEDTALPDLMEGLRARILEVAGDVGAKCVILDCFCGVDVLTTAGIGIADDAILVNEPDIVTFSGTVVLLNHLRGALADVPRTPRLRIVVNRLRRYSVAELTEMYDDSLAKDVDLTGDVLCHMPYHDRVFETFGVHPFASDLIPGSLFVKKLKLLTRKLWMDSAPELVDKQARTWSAAKTERVYQASVDPAAVDAGLLVEKMSSVPIRAGFWLVLALLTARTWPVSPPTARAMLLSLAAVAVVVVSGSLLHGLWLTFRLNLTVCMFRIRLAWKGQGAGESVRLVMLSVLPGMSSVLTLVTLIACAGGTLGGVVGLLSYTANVEFTIPGVDKPIAAAPTSGARLLDLATSTIFRVCTLKQYTVSGVAYDAANLPRRDGHGPRVFGLSTEVRPSGAILTDCLIPRRMFRDVDLVDVTFDRCLVGDASLAPVSALGRGSSFERVLGRRADGQFLTRAPGHFLSGFGGVVMENVRFERVSFARLDAVGAPRDGVRAMVFIGQCELTDVQIDLEGAWIVDLGSSVLKGVRITGAGVRVTHDGNAQPTDGSLLLGGGSWDLRGTLAAELVDPIMSNARDIDDRYSTLEGVVVGLQASQGQAGAPSALPLALKRLRTDGLVDYTEDNYGAASATPVGRLVAARVRTQRAAGGRRPGRLQLDLPAVPKMHTLHVNGSPRTQTLLLTDPAHWSRFDVEGDGVYVVDVHAHDGRPAVGLYGPGLPSRTIGYDDAGDDEPHRRRIVSRLRPGAYYVAVDGVGTSPLSFATTVSRLGRVALGERDTHTPTLDAGATAWYHFDLRSPDLYVVRAASDSGSPTLTVYAEASDGHGDFASAALRPTGTDHGDHQTSTASLVVGPAPGRYHVAVMHDSGTPASLQVSASRGRENLVLNADPVTRAFGQAPYWSRLTIEAAGVYAIDARSEDADPTITLYDADGGARIAFDDDGGDGRDSRIARVLSKGVYHVEVARLGRGSGVSADVAVQVSPVAVTAIPASGRPPERSLSPGRNEIVYGFAVDASAPYVINAMAANASTTMELHGGAGVLGGDAVTPEHVRLVAGLPPGNYHLSVTVEAEVDGQLSVEVSRQEVDREPVLVTAAGGARLLDQPDPVGWYRVDVDVPGIVAIGAANVPGLDMTLYSADTGGHPIPEAHGSGGTHLETMLAGGVYYLRVARGSPSLVAPITLSLGHRTPRTLRVDDPPSEVTVGSQGDWYGFDVDHAGPHILDAVAEDGDPVMYVYAAEPAARPIAKDDDGGEGYSSRIAVALEVGTYYLHVHDYTVGDSKQAASLSVQLRRPRNPE